MAKQFIVTGAAGFIGSHLVGALLKQGHRVVGIDNFDPFYDRRTKQDNVHRNRSPDFELVEADIRDAVLMRDAFHRAQPDGVFHLAALAGVRPSIEDPSRYVSVNLDGLSTVLESARSVDCRNFIFASSSSVYGNNKKVPFAEDDPVDEPISPYAATKRSGELICHTYAHLFGMSIAALRFFTVYGPCQRPDLAINKFMRLIAMQQEVPMFGDGSTSRDYTFIDDIISGVLASANRVAEADDGFFRIYNLGGSQPIQLSEMIAAIGAAVGKEPRIRRMPMQPGDVDRTFADLTRSRAELGYEPVTPFLDGLAKQWSWMKYVMTESSHSATG